MEQFIMLTDAKCRNATCPKDKKQARFADSGGMYLQVSPAGSKRWFLKYRVAGVEKQLALGGYRATGRTILRQVLKYPADVIEAQLAHIGQITHGGAYDRTTHLEDRTPMIQAWADYLDKLARGADVIPIK